MEKNFLNFTKDQFILSGIAGFVFVFIIFIYFYKTRQKKSDNKVNRSVPWRIAFRWNENHPVWESLEEALLSADLGPKLTEQFLKNLKQDFHGQVQEAHLKNKLREQMLAIFSNVKKQALLEAKPIVTVVMGVNGSGKTTSAGKLAYLQKQAGKKVIVGAGDTFRAAAVEQLKAWADRIGVECIMPAQGANPAAVAFDAITAGIARGADEIIIDTAGRLHTKDHLMEELKKVARVLTKKLPGAPHRVFLVLDATLGQNVIPQAKEFHAAIPATGIILTKLDSSSKGGAIIAIAAELGIPVEYVGTGENAADLQKFSAQEFVYHLIP